MQGVFTKFLQLWIPNKTDKGSVVTDVFEPNFTKLDQNAETTNQALSNLSSNKLDKSTYNGNAATLKADIDTRLPKGTYPGKASDLKTEIDNLNSNKYDKTGGKITGTVEIVGSSNNNVARVNFSDENSGLGYVGAINSPTSGQKHIGIYDAKNNTFVRLYADGSTGISGNNLETENKEIIKATNETYNLEKGIAGATTINYIQTPGQKIYNQIYFDKSVNPPTPYVCVIANTDITPTSNFILSTNANISMRSKRHIKQLLYNGGNIIANNSNAPAISISEYEFLLVRIRKGQQDLYSKNIISFSAGDVYIEGVILTVTGAGQVIVKNNGSTSSLTGLVEVNAYSFGYLL